MKEQLISFQTATLAKEKGFDGYCLYAYQETKTGHPTDAAIDFTGNLYFTKEDLYNAEENTSCLHYLAPTQSLLQKWLREVHNIILYVYYESEDADTMVYAYTICTESGDEYAPVHIRWQRKESWVMHTGYWSTYEEALERGLQEALKLIKK